jgi:predicted esterase
MSDATPREHRLSVTRSARAFARGGEAATGAWVLLHGYGQLASRFLRGFESLAAPSRLLVAPEGLSRFYLEAGAGRVGASWMTKEDRAHEISDYLAYLDLVRAQLVPPVPLTVLGFSQGVATAARWAVATTPAPVRLICWGGLVPEEISAAALGTTQVTYVVGEWEEWAPPSAVEAQAAGFRAGGMAVEVIRFEGGHEIRPEVAARLVRGRT